MPLLLIGLLAGCAAGPPTVTAVGVGASAVALSSDGRTGTLGVDGDARPVGTWTQLDVGGRTACALDPDGRPDCWELGTDALLSTVPAGPFRDLSVADGQAIFVFADGSLIHWPQAEHALPTDGPWVSVAAVGVDEVTHPGSCGVDEAGQLWCGAATDAAPGGPWRRVSRTAGQLCALDDAGAIRCLEISGGAWTELGGMDGPFVDMDTGGGAGVCGLRADGGVQCDAFGDRPGAWADYAPAGTGHEAIALSSDGTWGCAVKDGDVGCFGAPDAVPAGDWAW